MVCEKGVINVALTLWFPVNMNLGQVTKKIYLPLWTTITHLHKSASAITTSQCPCAGVNI